MLVHIHTIVKVNFIIHVIAPLEAVAQVVHFFVHHGTNVTEIILKFLRLAVLN